MGRPWAEQEREGQDRGGYALESGSPENRETQLSGAQAMSIRALPPKRAIYLIEVIPSGTLLVPLVDLGRKQLHYPIEVEGVKAITLVDTGAMYLFIQRTLVERSGLPLRPRAPL